MHKLILGLPRQLRAADYVSLASVAVGMMAIRSLMVQQRADALGFMLLAVTLDFVDGVIARRFGASTYGPYLDSFFDVIIYLVFPALSILQAADFRPVYLLPTTIMLIAGFLRLARFTHHGFSPSHPHHYVGMPVFYLLAIPLGLFFGLPPLIVSAAAVIASFFMVSEVLFRKPTSPLFPVVIFSAAVWFLTW